MKGKGGGGEGNMTQHPIPWDDLNNFNFSSPPYNQEASHDLLVQCSLKNFMLAVMTMHISLEAL